ncbi:MAG: hypothetical protein JNM34_10030 [Chthonomonadaceae bacterium]|nr:hypothetical protein [Chthonomonadaceae bacterium]
MRKLTLIIVGGALFSASAFVIAQQTKVWGHASGGGSASGQATAQAHAGGQAGGSASGLQFGHGFGIGLDPSKQLYAAWYETTSRTGVSPQLDQAHMKFVKHLMQDGTLIAEGPFKDSSGYLVIIQTKSDAEASKLLSEDPVAQSGAFRVSIKPWSWRLGGVSDRMSTFPVPAAGAQKSTRAGG